MFTAILFRQRIAEVMKSFNYQYFLRRKVLARIVYFLKEMF